MYYFSSNNSSRCFLGLLEARRCRLTTAVDGMSATQTELEAWVGGWPAFFYFSFLTDFDASQNK